MKNKPEPKTIIVPYFGAPRAALLSYPNAFRYQLSKLLCTHSRSGSRLSKGEAVRVLTAPASIKTENGISIPTVGFIKENNGTGNKKKAPRGYRAFFSHYLYVSPYWA